MIQMRRGCREPFIYLLTTLSYGNTHRNYFWDSGLDCLGHL